MTPRMTDVVLPPTFEQTASFTPGPWEIGSDDWQPWEGAVQIIGSDGETVCFTATNGHETLDAELICRRVNTFDDMMASLIACQKALAMMTNPGSIAASSIQHAWAAATAAESKARAALTKAQGQPSVSGGEESQ